MIATGKMEDGNWSENKIEVKEDLRTIECLRGRLLAERQASKVANADAEEMGNKLIELENLLKEETKLRNKAEKKLRLLKKKLESLNISFPLDKSEQSSLSSDIYAQSCKLSTTTSTSGLKGSEESESKPQITTPELEVSLKLDNNLLESASVQENSSCLHTANSSIKDPPHDISSEHSSPSCEDSKPENNNSMKVEMEAEKESDKEDHYGDNSLALVPVSNPTPEGISERNEVNKIISSGNVRDALDALRLAREMIQSSMESRHMIRVGHS